ncbi:MAG: acireductone synthase [Desulfarculaceae bacterium]|nr:acireductone synthase [Desulfarculaceae bacterium]MCF8073252.1 acireductone synthase [Desulfarculaceae bacterium]MCF8100848.1 acireductone synthase [Desulfarculaceae bacterium]
MTDQSQTVAFTARAVVVDIEGTTTPLAFVKEVLFPYARQRLPQFVVQHQDDPVVAEQLRLVRQTAGAELGLKQVGCLLRSWIDQDRKESSLKSLQGIIWREAYESGRIKGQVYPDAVRALKKWHRAGVPLYVYSSGSVEAQKLLFRHSEHGDLSGLFSGYFDLAVGGKKDRESYAAIAHSIGLPPESILFISDVKEELDAAEDAGMQSVWMVREGDLPLRGRHKLARDFSSI